MDLAASVGMPCCRVTVRRTRPPANGSGSVELEVLDRHAAADHPRLEHVPDGVHLELVVGDELNQVLGPLEVDRGLRSLEVVALGQFLLGLVDGVVDFLHVHGGRHIE